MQRDWKEEKEGEKQEKKNQATTVQSRLSENADDPGQQPRLSVVHTRFGSVMPSPSLCTASFSLAYILVCCLLSPSNVRPSPSNSDSVCGLVQQAKL